jgi:hypothetical protein
VPELELPPMVTTFWPLSNARPHLHPAIPAVNPQRSCTAVDDVFGQCQLASTPKHELHRVDWNDGFGASWRDTAIVLIHPI